MDIQDSYLRGTRKSFLRREFKRRAERLGIFLITQFSENVSQTRSG